MPNRNIIGIYNLILNNPRETSNEELEALKLFYKETNGRYYECIQHGHAGDWANVERIEF